MDYCEFCDYEDFESQVILSSDKSFAIYPRRPIFKYHFILFPKEHSRTIENSSQDSILDIYEVIGRLKSAFSEENDIFEGFNIFSNNGTKFAGQTVNHSHVHIFLRFPNEKSSPYEIMNGSVDKNEQTKTEWAANVDYFRSLFV